MGGTLSHRQYSRDDRRLERIYAMPRDCRSLEDYDRGRHLDLPGLTDDDLDREAIRVAHRWAYEPDRAPRGWLTERRDAIRAERDRRREADRRASAAPDPVGITWAPPRRARPATPGLVIRKGGRATTR